MAALVIAEQSNRNQKLLTLMKCPLTLPNPAPDQFAPTHKHTHTLRACQCSRCAHHCDSSEALLLLVTHSHSLMVFFWSPKLSLRKRDQIPESRPVFMFICRVIVCVLNVGY